MRDARYLAPFTASDTRVYAPVLPGEHPLTRNVILSDGSRAEAADTGRAARRPDTAFRPLGRDALTVARALKLIDGGALEQGSVAALAEKLGITSRHLARLFERHVGASPQHVATTRRVQRAKRLLDTTNDTMTEIAFRAGFGSLRRFNAAFADLTAARHRPSPRGAGGIDSIVSRSARRVCARISQARKYGEAHAVPLPPLS